jgi:C4-dicarboxylate transporter, DctM subunit
MLLTLSVLFIALLLLGVPIFLSIIIPSIVSFIFYFPTMDITVIIQRLIGGIDTFSLLAIPFFMFAAELMAKGNIGSRLVSLANRLVGHLPGGLLMATVLTCTLFGAISGTGPAAIVAVGTILFPALLKSGYQEKMSLGVIVSSSTLSMLIPPGVAMILYGVISGTSIGKVFIAGVSVGFMVAVIFCVFVYIYAKINNLPRAEKATFSEVLTSLKESILPLGLPVVILGGIYLGVMTPTEAAAIAVGYVFLVEVIIYRTLSLKDVFSIAVSSGRMVAMIFILIGAGSLLSWLLTIAQLPQQLVTILDGYSPIVVLLLINLIFIVAGMFLDPNSSIIILTPLVYPIAIAVGVDPVHLGILIVLNASIGMITPPFGLNIFVATGAFKIPYERVVPGLVPFILLSLIVLVIVTFFPQLVLWLPNLM